MSVAQDELRPMVQQNDCVSVIAATMMWAKRLRRLARAQGPAQKTVGNDFWFLKPPKPIASDKEIPGSHRPPLGEKRDETS